MAWRKHPASGTLVLAAIVALAIAPAAWAQFGGGFGGIGGGGIGGGGIGGGGTGGVGGVTGNAGVYVDAQGVLRMKIYRDPDPRLARQRLQAALASLNPELARPSKLRKVSLTRLERAVAERIAQNQPITDDMRCLAGLTGIEFVFFYPETNDIVIAGPAEGFVQDLSGRVVGVASGRATLLLEDLVVALRAFPPGGDGTDVIGCSIDPTPEGLARMQQFLRSIAGRVRPGDARRIAIGLRQSLGYQTVRVDGVSPNTHMAQVLVEADYRMKLIGIALEKPPVRIPSYVALANPRQVSRNALQRWYFTPNYECVRVSEDGLAMQLVGQGVKLVTQQEMVTARGGRVETEQADRASQQFVQTFTRMYPALAQRSPVFAQLRNVIDLSIAAAYIQRQDYYNQAQWSLGVWANEQQFPVQTSPAPRRVESVVNVVWKGNALMTPIGGGVNIQPRQALASNRLLPDEQAQLKQLRRQIQLKGLPAGRWWWD